MPMAVSAAAWLLVACGGGGTDSGGVTERTQSASVDSAVNGHRVAAAGTATASRIDPRLRAASGPVTVWVSLDQNSLAAQRVALAETAGLASRDGGGLKKEASLRDGVKIHRQRVEATQASLVAQLKALGGTEVARVKVAHNAVAIRIDAAQLAQVASLQGVRAVRPVVNYEMALSETVPYVGGSAVQARGYDGTGVTVAVLDSGIDYTHKNLGGAGTAAAFESAWGTGADGDVRYNTRDGLFPTAKVVGGHDFVGEDWPNSPEAEDDDPIDFQGHGTHVADIIGGKSTDGTHKGMAPGASLVAVKVCSAVATSCSGLALIKGVDYALDPNGDGDTSDAVDVMNLSLGSSYGQEEDDLTAALQNAVKLGVVVVASAGNSANRPYIVGSPSIGEGIISVAQTAVPSAKAIPLVVNSPAALAGTYGNTATMEWAPVGAGVTGDVVHVGRACPGDALLANPTGKIALIDRGTCSISLKVDIAAKAGATGVLLGLVAAGDAVSFSYGGGDTFVPTLTIQQSLSNRLKAALSGGMTPNVTMSEASAISLVGSMASTSSRGPSISFQSIKPEIGAPGASMSAEVGTGTGNTAFGGTSGAAPMVSGAAALLLQKFPNYSPLKIKALLMNSAETMVYTNPALLPGQLAPITRIGAGELRVDRALSLTSVAYHRGSRSSALSFGAPDVSRTVVLEKTLVVENLGNTWRSYNVVPSFRFADDEASGAVKVLTRSRVSVGPRSREELEVRLVIDPSKLPDWVLNGGSLGGDGNALNGPEYDGYLTLTSGSEKLSVPWHVLPRKAADADARLTSRGNPGPSLVLSNRGAADSEYDVFSLLATSPKAARGSLPQAGDNFAFVDLKAVGARYLAAYDVIEFAIATHGRRAHPNYPAGFEVDIDVNGDGAADFYVFNAESGGFAVSGQNLVFLQAATAASGSAFYYTDADLNSGNVILTVPFSRLGVAEGTTLTMDFLAIDNYFTGNVTDSVTGARFTPGSARFGVVGDPFGAVASRESATLGVASATLPDTTSSEQGLLVMFRRNAGNEAEAIRIR